MFPAGFLVVHSLLWCLCASSPLLHDRPPRMVDGGGKCGVDADCGDVASLRCDPQLQLCSCRDKDTVLSAAGGCLKARQLGEECAEHAQCRVLERNASCEEHSCVCDSGFYLLHENNGSLCSPDNKGGSDVPKAAVDVNMIIVLAVLSFMFVGICVALHLFSKARFRNRRTVFNSPHPGLMNNIRIGKRKKSSIRTHHLPPPPPPHHLATRHHSFSGHHSPYPVLKVSKTRSHECLRSTLSRESSPKFVRRPTTAPLAERESMPPSSEDIDAKTPELPLLNGSLSEEPIKAPGSPTVIITDADGAHTVVTHPRHPSDAPNAPDAPAEV